ncbi:MAG TPA: serine/threonine protein kinase [Myxococcota bacterium]|nr:serine/threonine protein kinase [Myxococcota bacterium]
MTSPPPRPALEHVERDPHARSFFALTPDRILDTVERQGLHPTGRCVALNSLENRVYDVELEPDGGEAPVRLVMKFYRPGRWSRETILDEHRFLAELAAQGLPVVPPVDLAAGSLPAAQGAASAVAPTASAPSLGGGALGTPVTLGETEGIFYAGFPRRRGRPPDELDDDTLRRLGRLLASIHNVGARAGAPHRLSLDPQRALVQSAEELAARGLFPAGVEARYLAAARALAALAAPWLEGVSCIRLHGDCHLGNLLVGVDGIVFVDFDDMIVGPAVQDLWLATPGRDGEALRQRDVLLDGYAELRAFDRSTLRLVEVLRAMRFVAYSAWVARRWDDPSFPRAFPDFHTERYWVEELRMLEEQRDLVERLGRGEDGAPAGGEPEQDLGGAGGEDDPAWKL